MFWGAIVNTVKGVQEALTIDNTISETEQHIGKLDLFSDMGAYEALEAKNNLLLAEYLLKSEDNDEVKVLLWKKVRMLMNNNLQAVESELQSEYATKLDIARIIVTLQQISGEIDSEIAKKNIEIGKRAIDVEDFADNCKKEIESIAQNVQHSLEQEAKKLSTISSSNRLLNAEIEKSRTYLNEVITQLKANNYVDTNKLSTSISQLYTVIYKNIEDRDKKYTEQSNTLSLVNENTKVQLTSMMNQMGSKTDRQIVAIHESIRQVSSETDNQMKEMQDSISRRLSQSEGKNESQLRELNKKAADMKKELDKISESLRRTSERFISSINQMENKTDEKLRRYIKYFIAAIIPLYLIMIIIAVLMIFN